jgi:hypothetical protein
MIRLNDARLSIQKSFGEFLATKAFTIVEEESFPEVFGNSYLLLENLAMRILIFSDRGIWDIDVASARRPDNWYPFYLILAYFKGLSEVQTLQEWRLDDKFSFLVERYDELKSLLDEGLVSFDQKLMELQRGWEKAWEYHS